MRGPSSENTITWDRKDANEQSVSENENDFNRRHALCKSTDWYHWPENIFHVTRLENLVSFVCVKYHPWSRWIPIRRNSTSRDKTNANEKFSVQRYTTSDTLLKRPGKTTLFRKFSVSLLRAIINNYPRQRSSIKPYPTCISAKKRSVNPGNTSSCANQTGLSRSEVQFIRFINSLWLIRSARLALEYFHKLHTNEYNRVLI